MEKKENKGKWLHAKHVVSSSICPPGARSMLLIVHYCEEDTNPMFREVVPVLAIESTIMETYSKHTYDEEKYPPIASSKKELLDDGYRFHSREREIRLVHNTNEIGVAATLDGDPASNGESRLVVCYWPQEEDEKRFEPIWKAMEEELKARTSVKARATGKRAEA